MPVWLWLKSHNRQTTSHTFTNAKVASAQKAENSGAVNTHTWMRTTVLARAKKASQHTSHFSKFKQERDVAESEDARPFQFLWNMDSAGRKFTSCT